MQTSTSKRFLIWVRIMGLGFREAQKDAAHSHHVQHAVCYNRRFKLGQCTLCPWRGIYEVFSVHEGFRYVLTLVGVGVTVKFRTRQS